MTALTTLRNIGPRSAYFLGAVGIQSVEDLKEIGVAPAYQRTKKVFPDQIGLELLYALQSAYLDLSWNQIPLPIKEQLLHEVSDSE